MQIICCRSQSCRSSNWETPGEIWTIAKWYFRRCGRGEIGVAVNFLLWLWSWCTYRISRSPNLRFLPNVRSVGSNIRKGLWRVSGRGSLQCRCGLFCRTRVSWRSSWILLLTTRGMGSIFKVDRSLFSSTVFESSWFSQEGEIKARTRLSCVSLLPGLNEERLTLRAMVFPYTRSLGSLLKLILIFRGAGGWRNRKVFSIFRALGFCRISGRQVILFPKVWADLLKTYFRENLIKCIPFWLKLAESNGPSLWTNCVSNAV